MPRKSFTQRFERAVSSTIPEDTWRAIIQGIDPRVWWSLQQTGQVWAITGRDPLRVGLVTSLPRSRRRSYYTGRRQRTVVAPVKPRPQRVLTTIVRIVRRWW